MSYNSEIREMLRDNGFELTQSGKRSTTWSDGRTRILVLREDSFKPRPPYERKLPDERLNP